MSSKIEKDIWLMGLRSAKCSKCQNNFTIYEDLSNFEAPGCLKCDKCKTYFMYWKESDTLKYVYKLSKDMQKDAVEKAFSPCVLCGGNLSEHDIYKGFPDECPKCGSKDIIVDKKKTAYEVEKKRIEIKKLVLNK